MLVPSPLHSIAPANTQGSSSSADGAHPLSVHRCRFVDYNPAAITAVAFPPLALPKSSSQSDSKADKNSNDVKTRSKRRFGNMAVGRANGNVEIYEWSIAEHAQEHTVQAQKAWVLSKVSNK